MAPALLIEVMLTEDVQAAFISDFLSLHSRLREQVEVLQHVERKHVSLSASERGSSNPLTAAAPPERVVGGTSSGAAFWPNIHLSSEGNTEFCCS